jgi:hypothetical protein
MPRVSAGVEVELRIIEYTWLRVVVDGEEVFVGSMEEGTTRTWYGQESIALRCGNAGGVEATVNGEPLGILGERGKVVDLEWLAEGVIPPSQGLATVAVTPQTTSEAEEYTVYSALIAAWYIGDETKLIVTDDHTYTYTWWHLTEDLDSRLSYVQQSLPDLTQEIIADFKAKNQQSHPLKPLFDLSVEYILVSEEEIQKIFQSGMDGWDKFYMKHPNSQGIMTLSRVGFNANMDRALVYVGNQHHWVAGSGHFVLLVKDNGKWIVSDEILVWVS